MSGEKRGVGIRLYVAGDEVVKRAFSGVADSGRKMWAEIALGSKSANPAVVALSRTSQEAQGAVGGLAARAGGASRVLGAFGVAGVGVAAVLGGMLLAFNKARETMDWADQLQDQADRLGISTEALQEYQYALRMAGGEAAAAGDAIESFQKKFGAARGEYGKRDMKPFAALGFTQEDLDSFESMEDALQATIDKIAALEDASEQAAIADKLGLSAMLPLIHEGVGGFQELASEARNLGVIMDSELVARAAASKDEFDTMAQVIDMQLKQAFVDLGPTIIDLMGLLAQLATKLSEVFEGFRNLEDKSMRGLQERRAELLRLAAIYMPGAMAGKSTAVAQMRQIDTQLAAVEFVIESRAAMARDRRKAGPSGGGGSLVSQVSSGGGGGPKAKEGPSPEELAARRAAIDLEQRMAIARASGSASTLQAIEDEKFLADQRKKYVEAGVADGEAAMFAEWDLHRRRLATALGEEVKALRSGGEGFTPTAETIGKISESIERGVDEAMAWEADRRRAWAEGVGGATAEGLDAALNGDFWEWFKAQLYRSALDGFGRGVSDALSGSAGDGVYGLSNWLFGGGDNGGPGGTGNGLTSQGGTSLGGWINSGLDAVFGGNRAAGGGMQDGAWYRVAEHRQPELLMVGGGGYVSDAANTARMMQDLAGGGRGGGRVGRMEVTIRQVLEVPAGYVPDGQLQQMMIQANSYAIDQAQQLAAENAPGAVITHKFLKG